MIFEPVCCWAMTTVPFCDCDQFGYVGPLCLVPTIVVFVLSAQRNMVLPPRTPTDGLVPEMSLKSKVGSHFDKPPFSPFYFLDSLHLSPIY
jgi:hypothetical protein